MKKIKPSDTDLVLALANNHAHSYREQFPAHLKPMASYLRKAIDEVAQFDVFISDDLSSHVVLEDYTDPCVDEKLLVYYVRKMYTRPEFRREGRMTSLIAEAKLNLNTDNVYSETELKKW